MASWSYRNETVSSRPLHRPARVARTSYELHTTLIGPVDRQFSTGERDIQPALTSGMADRGQVPPYLSAEPGASFQVDSGETWVVSKRARRAAISSASGAPGRARIWASSAK